MTRRAVCVGINNFRDPDINALRGCVNDARNVSQVLLRDFGFDPNGVHVLTNQQATKQAYLQALEWLVSSARPGDELVLYTSTHGSHIPDKDGDEDDGEDEVLVVYDHDWETNVLIDDEIARHVSKVPQGVSFAMFWDTCHSGTMEDVCNPEYETREVKRPGARDVAPLAAGVQLVGSRYIEPPQWLYKGRKSASTRAVAPKAARSKVRAQTSGHIHSEHGQNFPAVSISGCADDQTSADASFGGVNEGAFTHCLLEVIRKSQGDLSWEQLHQGTLRLIKEKGFDQTPQVHVPASLQGRPAFGGRSGRAVSAGVTPSPMSHDTSAIDQQIQQFEAQGRWADSAAALQKRLGLVSDTHEQVRTLEHLVSLYRVKLHDEPRAVATTERLVEIAPTHQGAVASLRHIYAAQGNQAKLQALDARIAQSAQQGGGSKGILGNVGSTVSGALSSAGAAVSTAAAGVFTAVTSAPVAYEQPTATPPKPAGPPKCPYCGNVVGAGVKTCSACGGAW